MIINRAWCMPSKWTFEMRPVHDLVLKYVGSGENWADPFAGKNTFAQYRNDIDPKNGQSWCMDAHDFLAQIEFPLEGIIFDPPYSLTQMARSYKALGVKPAGNPNGGFPKVKDLAARLVGIEGYVISFGWNSTGMGKVRGFESVEILILNHGGNHNDTICKVERKIR